MTALGAAPSRADHANFSARADALLTALPTFVTEANALEANVVAKEASAAAQAGLATTNGAAQVTLAAAQVTLATAQVTLATAQAGLATTNGAAQVALATTQANNSATSAAIALGAVATSGALAWVNGNTYAIGNTVYSPDNLQTYRCAVAGVSAVDPSIDNTTWKPLGGSSVGARLLFSAGA
jgi:predicted O-linked N-acetylglucosamine transferase (SPINDLY family)